MKVKLSNVTTKSFVLIFSVINVFAGLILGTIVTIVSLISPSEQGVGEMGPWSIIIFPILNGILGMMTGAFFTIMYNFFSKKLGGIELEFENQE